MALADGLAGRRVYLDSNIFIYAFENTPGFSRTSTAILWMVDDGLMEGFASEISLVELLPKPLAAGQTELAQMYLQWLGLESRLRMFAISRDILLRAAALRSAARRSSIDAIHLATALETGCDYLVTADREIKTVDGLEVVHLARE